MELSGLRGVIIGVVSNDYKEKDYDEKLVEEIVIKKPADALKMVGLSLDILKQKYIDLSSREKSLVILASKLQDKVITLVNFSKGLTKKDLDNFRRLFKRIVTYNRRIVLVDKNSELFLNCVDKLYVINKGEIIMETTDLFDQNLHKYIDVPKIVEFTSAAKEKGININHYKEFDDLLKAIYRIKS